VAAIGLSVGGTNLSVRQCLRHVANAILQTYAFVFVRGVFGCFILFFANEHYFSTQRRKRRQAAKMERFAFSLASLRLCVFALKERWFAMTENEIAKINRGRRD